MSLGLLYLLIIAYLYLPILLFLIGWVTPIVSIPVLIVSFIGIFFACRKTYASNKMKKLPISIPEMLLVFLLLIGFLVLAGHGDLFPQDFDWHKHHAIYSDLLLFRWPVVYHNDSMLTYYLGQYLVPAAVAKVLFHSPMVLQITIPIWNALGLLLVYLFLTSHFNCTSTARKCGVLLALCFWGGCTNLGSLVYRMLGYDTFGMLSGQYKWIDFVRVQIHYASNFDSLYGSFQHSIIPWLSCCFFLGNRKQHSSYVMIALPLMFGATFGFVYFAALLAFFAVFDLIAQKDKKAILRGIFSAGNLLLVPISLLLLLYLSGNFLGDKPDLVGFRIIDMREYLDFYIIFIFAEFLGYAIFLFYRNRRNILFYAIIVELLVIPFFSLGMFNDLCSRGAVPARFILMVLCIDQLYNLRLSSWRNLGLAALLSIAALNSSVQLSASLDKAVAGWETKTYVNNAYLTFDGYAANPDVRVDEAYNYFTIDYSHSLFQKIARKN